MRRPPEALGTLLAALRTRARMSQRELSRASEVSYTQIGDLERGTGGHPSPTTLRALAKGLASDAFLPEGYDSSRADAFYRQLMDAAGYLRGLAVDAPPQAAAQETTEDAVVLFLAARTGDASLAANLVSLARRFPDLSPDEQTVVRHLVGTWVRES